MIWGLGPLWGFCPFLAPKTGLTLADISETRFWRTNYIFSILFGLKSK